MKKNRLIIGISALALCVCAAVVLAVVVLNPSANNASGSEPSTESSASELTTGAQQPSAPDASQSETASREPVTASGGVPAAPAPIDLTPDSITALVNRDYKLTEDYIPEDLVVPDVRFTFSYYDDKKLMRSEAAAALEELFAAGDREGIKLYGVSAYRSYTRQYTIYATNLITKGVNHTNRYSAAPGASEHQTGLVIDVSSVSAGQSLEEIFGTTPEGIWLAENASRFGFIIRYPKDMEDLTGYYYEPWHIRYVGKPLAAYLYENGLTLDEYYGYEPSVPFSTLADTPLIDTESERYLSLCQSLRKPSPAPSEPAGNTNSTEPDTDNHTSQTNPSAPSGTEQAQPPEEIPDVSEPGASADTTNAAESTETGTENSKPGETAGASESSGTSEPAVSPESPEASGSTKPDTGMETTEAPGTSQPDTGTEITEAPGTPEQDAGTTEASVPPEQNESPETAGTPKTDGTAEPSAAPESAE